MHELHKFNQPNLHTFLYIVFLFIYQYSYTEYIRNIKNIWFIIFQGMSADIPWHIVAAPMTYVSLNELFKLDWAKDFGVS